MAGEDSMIKPTYTRDISSGTFCTEFQEQRGPQTRSLDTRVPRNARGKKRVGEIEKWMVQRERERGRTVVAL